MTMIPPIRRVALAAVALAVSALLFHGTIASALVTRGDDLLRAGSTGSAIDAYARAVTWDPYSPVGPDRLAFALVLRRAPGDAKRAYVVADRALRTIPDDTTLHVDRGFAASRLTRWGDAERDFAWAARRAHDPRYAHLAARMAEREHETLREREDLHVALALDGRYAPARALLRRLGE
jgi:Flp pilus assembly protein TadD